MGNTRPGAVRHSTAAATHRARVGASLFGPRVTTATPQHGSRASSVTHRHPSTAPHAWGTLAPPRGNETASEAAAVRGVRQGKKIAKAKPMAIEGVWEGGWHWAYLRLTTDEEDVECLVTIRRKMNSYSWIRVAHDVGVGACHTRVERGFIANMGSP